MSTKKTLEEILKTIIDLENKGQKTVPVSNLKNYIASFDGDNIDSNARHIFESELERWKANNAIGIEMFKSVIEAGLNALKSAMIINGGASVALLAFMGALLSASTFDGQADLVKNVGIALLVFMFSTGFAGVGFILGVHCYCKVIGLENSTHKIQYLPLEDYTSFQKSVEEAQDKETGELNLEDYEKKRKKELLKSLTKAYSEE